jgi:hypothetical protein
VFSTKLIPLACLLSLTSGAWAKPDPKPAVVKVALLLDTSNSMDGLIDQAKSQLWKIVNELSSARVEGKVPRLEVALYEYGNDSLPVNKNYIRQVLPLTADLDRLSEELFRLKTNGGSEFCGAVIRDSLKELKWSNGPKDMQAIFIAGNEPFDQGPISFKESCAQARQKGVLVNTIFCGARGEGAESHWSEGAELAGGRYLVIDQDQKVAEVPTPYDSELQKLGRDLNKTYIQYGVGGNAGAARQESMDEAAAESAPSVAANRAQSKASSNYNNAAWDLVDADKQGQVKLESVPKDQLPVEMQKLPVTERRAYVDKKSAERSQIKARIQKLSKQREDYLAKNQPKQEKESLDTALLKTIREQARNKGYQFK